MILYRGFLKNFFCENNWQKLHIKGPDKSLKNLFSETTLPFFCGKFVKMDQWLIKNEIHSPICFDPIPQGIMLT
jgi:hypothetical protein